MKVYLAAPYGSRDTIRDYAAHITDLGFTVTSSWLNETHAITAGTQGAAAALSDAQVAGHAQDDLDDITDSDAFVLFTAASVGVEGGGGRHVETGYAISCGIPVIVVGEPENVFHRLPAACTLVPHWVAAVAELAARLAEGRGR